jgi:Tfp pilus assembly protein PilN
VGRDSERHLVAVDVAILPHQRVVPVEARLRALGMAAQGVDVEGDDGIPQGFDLREPPSAEALARKRNRNLLLALGALVIWGLAFYAWRDSGTREAAAWQTRIAEIKPAAERSAALRRQIEALAAPIAAANAYDPAAMLSVLAELTRVLPDTVRVLDLKVEGDRLQIAGLATSAPPLIGLLEQSAMFADVKAVSAFVRRPESAKERFEIVMRIERRAP